MSTNRNLLTSPIGDIQFMSAENAIEDQNGKSTYTVRIAYDVKKDAEWLEQISEINYAKVVTKQTYRGKNEAVKEILSKGKALVSASSIYKPICYDTAGNEMEENPLFFPESTGTAQMLVQPYRGEKGGTINLMGIIIHSLDNPESTGTDREARLAQLREAVEAATKNS